MNERRVRFSRDFLRDIKQLSKKYRHVVEDFAPLVERLKAGETPGDQIRGTGYSVFKVRLRNSDVQRGKSGGYRVVYYLRSQDEVILLTLFSKSEQEDVSVDTIRRFIQDVLNEQNGEA
jgi:mRNA-degrading endonuclease RelE of RelBE toxin-antitoxin system